ncbi:MAG: UDP-N-acetylmuramoyl-tripeptide--D-alanyl-D-alanine ligase [Pseudomonadota bacterium]
MKQLIPWSEDEILKATEGVVVSGENRHTFTGISIDSRTITAGELFVAIEGINFDGHNFAKEVITKNIKGLVINRQKTAELLCNKSDNPDLFCVEVDNTTKALGDIAAYNRKRANVSVIAITGSNGKTSTREMTSAIVSRHFDTLSTIGNLNNEIGLPLTLLKLSPFNKWAVVELGTNHPGEIARLAKICKPDIGIITNIGRAHLEGLKSIEGVMNAKGELLNDIKPGGTVILNADDERVMRLARKTQRNKIYFGLSQKALIKASSIEINKTSTSFTLKLPEDAIRVELPVTGHFMVSNALAAASVGYLLKLSAHDIKAGLENFTSAKSRMNIFALGNGVTVIDDTYNANPDSMEAAIRSLAGLKGNKRGVLVAGDMLELGIYSEALHKKIGEFCAEFGVERLYATGQFSANVAAGAIIGGMDVSSVFTGSQEDIISDLKEWLMPTDCILIKGSRAMAMEKIVAKLKEWAGTSAELIKDKA